ncbi:hypothetical protein [Pseudomonas sp. UFMG81]|jgi:hypothetical protein|uniref:hypothetical protein n=1 Tax=Pseudomonas sp. UFMG81 TaxID=2745936 RepID=UPI00188F1847|nr:hypothetical protein [Pseudomonas sp. UFMG81]
MTTISRLSLMTLLAGMLLGDIVVASIGLAGLCIAAVHFNILQDHQQSEPSDQSFVA